MCDIISRISEITFQVAPHQSGLQMFGWNDQHEECHRKQYNNKDQQYEVGEQTCTEIAYAWNNRL